MNTLSVVEIEEIRSDIIEVALSEMGWSHPRIGGPEEVMVPKAARQIVTALAKTIPDGKVAANRGYLNRDTVLFLRDEAWKVQNSIDEKAKQLHQALAD